MLVISRKIGQPTSLSIESNGALAALGTVVVNKIEGNKVSLGFELRKDVRIVRHDANEPKSERAA